MGWPDVVIEILKAAPSIIQAFENLIPDSGKGAEKHAGAVRALRDNEPLAIVQTPELTKARDAKIAADVAYANALEQALHE